MVSHLSLMNILERGEEENQGDSVNLMTLHAAKGLEFPFVYIVGLEEDLFPSAMSMNTRSELEEERRLFYVALTRAMSRVCLTYATSRFRWGNVTYCEPSRFIEEIDAQFISKPVERAKFPTRTSENPEKTFNIIHRLHWILLVTSLITTAGAVAGSHGWFWIK